MRRIDPDKIAQAVQPFLDELGAKQAAIDTTVDLVQRRTLVRAVPRCWRQLRLALAAVNNGKCWYTESWTDADELDIDHFRPKGHVHGLKNHPGYYWLAYKPENFRMCRKLTNSRRTAANRGIVGKGDFFPLLNEPLRAFSPGDETHEQPALLDPVDYGDTLLLSYSPENGEPQLDPKYRGDEVAETRFRLTRELFNLDQYNGYRYVLYNRIKRHIGSVEKELRRVPLRRDSVIPSDHPAMRYIDEIERLVSYDAEFATATRGFVATRPNWWIRPYVLRIHDRADCA